MPHALVLLLLTAAFAVPFGSVARAAADGPDWWQVRGIASGDRLNIRTGPSTANRVVTSMPNGFVLRNLGCIRRSQRWCEVAAPDGRFNGWVAGRYLAESGPPGQAVGGRPTGLGAPELFERRTGELEVRWRSGCTLLYSQRGTLITAGRSCGPRARRRADEAVARYRREQAGGDGHGGAGPGGAVVATQTMSRYCVGAAAGHFNTRTGRLEVDRPLNLGFGYVTVGRFRDRPTRAFRCQFDPRGVFQGVFQ